MFAPISDHIHLRNIKKKYKMGPQTIGQRSRESNSFIVLYGILSKNILQPMEVITLSKKGMKTKLGNFMEITGVL